ncbi:MAG: FAD-dependent oxidoreductase, partial [Thermoanaerobaculia bacterium]|nr:FAD-dependent oxidoreductase [Thermoanaerobaculia bacterium]
MVKKAGHIAVAGAGVIGLCVALAAARAGHRVTIYDPGGFPALGSASAIAGGMLAPFAEADHMPAPWVAAGLRSIELWQELEAFCGTDFGLRRAGSLLVAHGADAHILARFQTYLRAHGDFLWLRAPEIAEHAPMLGAGFDAGLYLPQEAHLNPAAALTALVDALRDQNVMLV